MGLYEGDSYSDDEIDTDDEDGEITLTTPIEINVRIEQPALAYAWALGLTYFLLGGGFALLMARLTGRLV